MSGSQSSPTDTADSATEPLLSRRLSSRASLHGAALLLRHREESVRVRETAAAQIEARQSDWAYSTPIVALDLLWNAFFVAAAAVVVGVSGDETTSVPLRLWVVGYGFQCVVHMGCVSVEYRRRREMRNGERLSYSNSGSNLGSGSGSDGGDLVEFVSEHQEGEDNVSVAKHIESANTMFSFIWWITGFYWISSGGQALARDAPLLYWLCLAFLAFDVFFVVICVAVACIIGIAVCCCLPCIIAILYAAADQEGASREDIELLPKYKFRRVGDFEKQNGEIQESFGGIMTECDTDSPVERVLYRDDAECCICLGGYEDGSELRELPCRHHFHCGCIDKWLHINATCPLCKLNILKSTASPIVEEP